MEAKAIQICGTGSGVGKSVIAAGLCRIFTQDGFRVAPFKAQNMSLNSFVTAGGGEMGRAQVLQAQACRLEPSCDMNPILLKPATDTGAQVIVRGKPVGNMTACAYHAYKDKAWGEVLKAFRALKKNFEVVVIEGAGSPAEVNLKPHDIVNLRMAQAAGAPVVLVGDIDKGGIFAWLIGTLELLTEKERRMIRGFIINKFRGDKRLLKPGIGFLEKRTGVKVLGVVPYFKDIRLPEEDSVALEMRNQKPVTRNQKKDLIDIAVIKLPHISNFTDFDSLANEPDVRLRYVQERGELEDADAIIIPGTKNTIADLAWLKRSGLAGILLTTLNSHLSTLLIGICGGYQMLGEKIRDSYRIESKTKEVAGLGVLPIATRFEEEKVLAQVKALDLDTGLEVSGYEIHHGRTEYLKPSRAAFEIVERQGKRIKAPDGNMSDDGRTWGTYIHGVFDEDIFRRNFLNRLRGKKGLPLIHRQASRDSDRELDKLARLLRDNIDIDSLYKIGGIVLSREGMKYRRSNRPRHREEPCGLLLGRRSDL